MNVRLIAILAVAAVMGLLGGLWLATSQQPGDDQFASCRASSIAGGAASIGGPFELVNGAGDTVTDADVITKPSLLYFGYTFCPDVCPFDVARNADAVDLLETDAGLEITPVFISIDPARDTPAVVADYGDVMHDRMVALTGSPQQVASASQAYRAYYKAHDSGDEFYLVDHSTFTYLVFPEHGFVEFYRRELTAEEMAASVACFVENA